MQPLRPQAAQPAPQPSTNRPTPSEPDVAALAARFVEPLRGDNPPAPRRPAPSKPPMVQPPIVHGAGHFLAPQAATNTRPSPPKLPEPAKPQAKPGLPRNALVSAVALLALVPLGLLFVQLWQDAVRPGGADGVVPAEVSEAITPNATVALDVAPPAQETGRLGLAARTGAVTSQARSGAVIAPLPPQVATTDDPLSDDFLSAGLASAEQIAATGGGADSTPAAPVAQSEAIKSAPSVQIAQAEAVESTPSEAVAQAETTENTPAAQIATAEVTGSVADAPPLPQQKPEVTVHTVKTVAIAPPHETKPYDGGYGLGPATEAPTSVEWMETKTAVDMHAKAEQSSETVNVAQGGVKMRVMARDNRWIQVNDPATSTTGWIYDRFLTPAEPPAQ